MAHLLFAYVNNSPRRSARVEVDERTGTLFVSLEQAGQLFHQEQYGSGIQELQMAKTTGYLWAMEGEYPGNAH